MRHVPGLDAVRGAAVLAVVGYHSGFSQARGGTLAVDSFFVLSGFLISRALLAELSRDDGIGLPAFYLRRLVRLLPALLVVLSTVVLLDTAGLLPPFTGGSALGAAVASVTYTSNWAMTHDAHRFGVLQHTWSLSIEEQYYLVWPVALLLVRSRALLTMICAAGVLVSGLAMALLWAPAVAPAVYYRTDTRCGPLLLGCLLALTHARRPVVAARTRRVVGAAAVSGVIFLVIAMTSFDVGLHQAVAFRGVIQTGWLASAAAIAGCLWASPERFTRLCSTRAVALLAASSYGAYLWNPVLVGLLAHGPGPLDHARGGAAVVLSLLAGTASWFLVERPLVRRFRPAQGVGSTSRKTVQV